MVRVEVRVRVRVKVRVCDATGERAHWRVKR
jgi:hypothetical protein